MAVLELVTHHPRDDVVRRGLLLPTGLDLAQDVGVELELRVALQALSGAGDRLLLDHRGGPRVELLCVVLGDTEHVRDDP